MSHEKMCASNVDPSTGGIISRSSQFFREQKIKFMAWILHSSQYYDGTSTFAMGRGKQAMLLQPTTRPKIWIGCKDVKLGHQLDELFNLFAHLPLLLPRSAIATLAIASRSFQIANITAIIVYTVGTNFFSVTIQKGSLSPSL
jgi:hypothetical protein